MGQAFHLPYSSARRAAPSVRTRNVAFWGKGRQRFLSFTPASPYR